MNLHLHSSVEELSRLQEPQKKALRKLGIKTIEDLLYHFPARYGDVAKMRPISGLVRGEKVVVFGRISKLETGKGFRSRVSMATAELADDTGKIQIVWFNQPYIAKMIPEGALVRVEGAVSERRKGNALYFSNPKIEKMESAPQAVGESLFGIGGEDHHLYPVYPESRGITSNWFFHAIQKIFKAGVLEDVSDPIPTDILEKYHLPSWKSALIWVHAPKKEGDALAARKRFSFEEVFFIQLEKQKERKLWQQQKAFTIEKGEEHIGAFTKRFPFSLTNAQNRSISGILDDFRRGTPMARLLE